MESIKILFVGNSFAVDTMEHAAPIARSLGVARVKLGTLYVGGCSIGMHYEHAMTDAAVYTYYTNEGEGWVSTPGRSIRDAVVSEAWDVIAIQHGTHGTSRYTSVECYEKLDGLIDYLRALAPAHTRIVFNLTWLGEPTRAHHEILSYGGDTVLMRQRLVEVTEQVIVSNPRVDLLVPTGTAIENARTSHIGILTRDGYHLSRDKGRYIAGLTFISTVTGLAAERIAWTPPGVDEYDRQVAVESAINAQRYPLAVTPSKL